jgi:hypothetical protein
MSGGNCATVHLQLPDKNEIDCHIYFVTIVGIESRCTSCYDGTGGSRLAPHIFPFYIQIFKEPE